ncbi:cation diffusion facilitator family transporter [Patescibacteria group bacterium]|nr:cation diffusion facilitator family transporter [Patescibacteria group bacterium]
MNPQSVSIISTIANLGLGISKLIFGFLIGSVALIADGIHSGLDIFSSFITFLGLKVAKKPVDEAHPYGHWRAESLAGFLVAILLAISGIWILYEAIKRFFGESVVKFSYQAIILVGVSILITEILARLKFHFGRKYQSLSLVADAEHSRADALSSIGVLGGLFLIRYFNLADAIVALGIGGFILLKTFKIGKEITDSLLDVSNKEVEERIKKICQAHQIEISDLKTRKIGAYNFAEIKIELPPKLKVENVQKITETLEERLLRNIPVLKQIVIAVEAYEMARTVVLPKFGKRIGELEGFEQIGPKKLGERITVPLEGEEISPRFGAAQYLVIDKKEGKILFKEIVKNPYFEKDSPRGARFIKAVRADKVFTYRIGPNAKQNLENFGIEVEIIPFGKSLDEILRDIKKENGNEN